MKKLLSVLAISSQLLAISFSCSAQFTDLLDFNGTTASPQGSVAVGSLTPSVTGDTLFGMTQNGGIYGNGVVFSVRTDGTNYHDMLEFYGANGKYPTASLTLSGNTLYGMTYMGGANYVGIIFSIKTDGTGYTDLFDFSGTSGTYPEGSLIISGSILYGMTSKGGANDSGTIFSIQANGTGYTDLFDFDGTNGASPYGTLTLWGGKLYGTTVFAGPRDSSFGNVFSIDTNGTDYTDLLEFNGINGKNPYGSLSLSVTGGTLYGITALGGVNNAGTIFSIDTNGARYADRYDFNYSSGGRPHGSLILLGNTLYGMASVGGADNYGDIFSIDTNGAGYKDLFDFNGINGANPMGSLTFLGSTLYGMAENGGTGQAEGTVFSFIPPVMGLNTITNNSSDILIYPNPSNGIFTLQINNEKLIMKNIEVYNMLGEMIYTQYSIHGTKYNIDLSNQPNGIYLVRILDNEGNLVLEQKLVKEN